MREARVSAAVRAIEATPDAPHTLATLAGEAGVSPYHFLRTFRQVTGVTPHQYVLRARLRAAAWRLATPTPVRILDVALDSGFGDAVELRPRVPDGVRRVAAGLPERFVGSRCL